MIALAVVVVLLFLFLFPSFAQNDVNNSFTVPTAITGLGNAGSGIALNPGTDTVYSTGSGCTSTQCTGGNSNFYLFVIDGATAKITNKIRINGAEGVAVNQQTNTVYVAAGNSVAVINGATEQVVANITAQSSHIAVDPTTDMVYTDYFNHSSSYVTSSFTVIDGSTNAVVATLPTGGSVGASTVGGGLGAGAIAVDAATNTIYVASEIGYGQSDGSTFSYLSVIDGASNTLTQNIKLTEADGSGGTAVAVDSQANKVYVSTWGPGAGGDIAVIDGGTDSIVANVHLSSGSYGVTVDENTHAVFASLSGGTSVQVISGATDAIVAQATFLTKNLGQVPSGVVYDPATDTLYVACVNAIGSVSAISNMPTS